MIVPVAPTGEHDGSVAHRHVVVLIEKLFVADFEHEARFTVIGVGKENRQVLVIASQRFGPKGFAVDPAEAWRVIVALVKRDLDPYRLAAMRRHYGQVHIGIGIARLRIALPIHRA